MIKILLLAILSLNIYAEEFQRLVETNQLKELKLQEDAWIISAGILPDNHKYIILHIIIPPGALLPINKIYKFYIQDDSKNWEQVSLDNVELLRDGGTKKFFFSNNQKLSGMFIVFALSRKKQSELNNEKVIDYIYNNKVALE